MHDDAWSRRQGVSSAVVVPPHGLLCDLRGAEAATALTSSRASSPSFFSTLDSVSLIAYLTNPLVHLALVSVLLASCCHNCLWYQRLRKSWRGIPRCPSLAAHGPNRHGPVSRTRVEYANSSPG